MLSLSKPCENCNKPMHGGVYRASHVCPHCLHEHENIKSRRKKRRNMVKPTPVEPLVSDAPEHTIEPAPMPVAAVYDEPDYETSEAEASQYETASAADTLSEVEALEAEIAQAEAAAFGALPTAEVSEIAAEEAYDYAASAAELEATYGEPAESDSPADSVEEPVAQPVEEPVHKAEASTRETAEFTRSPAPQEQEREQEYDEVAASIAAAYGSADDAKPASASKATAPKSADGRPVGGYSNEDEAQPGDYAYDEYKPTEEYADVPAASFVKPSAPVTGKEKPVAAAITQETPPAATIDSDEVTLTTKSSEQYEVLMTLEPVTANCILSVGITPDMFTDGKFTGARSEKIQAALKQGRKDVLNQLRSSAYELGGNLVTDIDVKSGMKLLDKSSAKITVSATGEALSAELNSELMA